MRRDNLFTNAGKTSSPLSQKKKKGFFFMKNMKTALSAVLASAMIFGAAMASAGTYSASAKEKIEKAGGKAEVI